MAFKSAMNERERKTLADFAGEVIVKIASSMLLFVLFEGLPLSELSLIYIFKCFLADHFFIV